MSKMTMEIKEALKGFPWFQQQEKEQTAALGVERAAQIRKIAQLREEQSKAWVSDSTAFNKANQELEAAQKQLQVATGARERAYTARHNTQHAYETQSRALARELVSTAPGCIANFAAECMETWEAARKGFKSYTEPTGRSHVASGRDELRAFSNVRSVDARLAALLNDLRWAKEQAALELATADEAGEEIARRLTLWPELKVEAVA